MAEASTSPLYTCLTCRLGFRAPEHQRQHYGSDFHRYNAKRKVAELPPVSPEVFDTKVIERRAQQKAQESVAAGEGPSRQFNCKPCGKTFGTKNAQEAHFASKKHREALARGVAQLVNSPQPTTNATVEGEGGVTQAGQGVAVPLPPPTSAAMDVDAPTPSSSSSNACLFCPLLSPSLPQNLSHMLHTHGFFVPDSEYLVDPSGLVAQLADEISGENMCIFCGQGFGARGGGGGGGAGGEGGVSEEVRRRRGLEAVRKHMIDKGHCKIAWDTEEERLAFSDHYDFTSSYDAVPGGASSSDQLSDVASDDGDNDWDDVLSSEEEEPDLRPSNSVRYGSTPFELVLPSGSRIGHRSLRYVYRQNLLPYYDSSPSASVSDNSKIGRLASAHQRRKDRLGGALIPAKGAGFKPGEEGQVIKARNKGEAKMAMRRFVGERRQFEFETKRGFRGNNQKHFRDPLLQ